MSTPVYSPQFNRAVEFALAHETEYRTGHFGEDNYVITEHDEDDPGGTTRYGIDQRSHPTVDIEHLTREQAISIYWGDYWLAAKCDQLPPGFAEAVFDIAVNNGRGAAVRMLQYAVGTAQDGILGPLTVKATHHADKEALSRLLHKRELFYRQLANRSVRMRKYLTGWLNRNRDLENLVGVVA